MKKGFMRMSICFLLIAALYFLKEVPVHAAEIIGSGTCGENLQWELDDEGLLTISGTGDMYNYYCDSCEEYDWDYDEFDVPWADYDYNDMVQSVYIEEGVTSIGHGAFSYLDTLKEVFIPQGIRSIGYDAFYRSGIVEIQIPDSVKEIKQRAFLDCENLKKIVVDNNNENYTSDQSGVLFNKDKTILIVTPGGISGKYTIPDSVERVSDYAFYGCAQLKDISLSDNIDQLGKYAFGYCNGITKIELPNRLVTIGDYAFSGSRALKKIVIPDSVTDMGMHTFQYCSELESVVIPKNVKVIKEYAFSGCQKLSDVRISNSVELIEAFAFSNCLSLETIDIPNSVTTLKSGVFMYSNNLKNVTFGTGLQVLGRQAFYGCTGLKEVKFYGKAPELTMDCFLEVIATCYYPKGDKTWTKEVRQNYGGKLTWVAYEKETSELASPTVTVTNQKSSIKLSWKKVKGATGYVIYRKLSGDSSFKKVKTINSGSTVSYTDSNIKQGNTYVYRVRATKDGKQSGYTQKTIVRLKNPTVTKSNAANGTKLSWNRVTGATGYVIYRKAASASSYTKIKTISSGKTLNYTDTTAKNGTVYTYRIRATKDGSQSLYTQVKMVRLNRPEITSAKNADDRAITLKWKKNAQATGYQIKYVTGETTKTVTVKKNATVSYTIKKLTKGKTYKVYVRSYKTVDDTKYYSAWSAYKSVKVKKNDY